MTTALIKPQWSFVTIALMVAGFMIFWPLGLAVLAYIVWGEYFGGSADRARGWMNRQAERAGHCGPMHRRNGHFGRSASGNAAFDDYREEQLRRLDEERRRLDEEIKEFHDYMRNLRMARDREEFDRFMRDRTGSRQANGDSPQSV